MIELQYLISTDQPGKSFVPLCPVFEVIIACGALGGKLHQVCGGVFLKECKSKV